jgi:hypothetical protein
MHLLARARWVLARRPWIYWAIVAVIASGVGLQVSAALGRVDAARRSWGASRTVWVTTADVAASGRAGLIPSGWVAVAVPAGFAHFGVGDQVVLFASDRRIGAGVIVDLGDQDALVAVAGGDAPALAAAVLAGDVTLGLSSGS